MKKLILLLLTLALAVTMLPMVAAAEGEGEDPGALPLSDPPCAHSWTVVDGSCNGESHKAVCGSCGEETRMSCNYGSPTSDGPAGHSGKCAYGGKEETVAHSFSGGACSVCGQPCAHSYSEGVCSVCGVSCSHSWTVESGSCNGESHKAVCGVCGMATRMTCNYGSPTSDGASGHSEKCPYGGKKETVAHSYSGGACSVCGHPCAHTFSSGVCSACGEACTHGNLSAVSGTGDGTSHDTRCGLCGEIAGTAPCQLGSSTPNGAAGHSQKCGCGYQAATVDHTYSAGVCSDCGYACTHTYKAGICSACGEACAHGDWSIVTGTSNGESHQARCGLCGEIPTRMSCSFASPTSDGAAGHSQKCACGAKKETVDHTYSAGVCSGCGYTCTHTYKAGVCSVCGVACTHGDWSIVTGTGDGVSHQVRCGLCSEVPTRMTCQLGDVTSEGTAGHSQKCACGYKTKAAAHTFANGVCSGCGASEAALKCKHDGTLTYTNNKNGTHTVTCAKCKEAVKTKEVHDISYGDPVCDCGEVCRHPLGVDLVNQRRYGHDVYCKVCGSLMSEGVRHTFIKSTGKCECGATRIYRSSRRLDRMPKTGDPLALILGSSMAAGLAGCVLLDKKKKR